MTQKIERRKSSCNCIIKPSFFHKFASMLFARLCKTFCLKEITQKVYLASAATFILFATFLVLLWLLKEFGDATHSRLFANSTSLLGYFCWIVPWWVIFSSTLPRPTISWCYQCQLPAKEIISPLSLCQSLYHSSCKNGTIFLLSSSFREANMALPFSHPFWDLAIRFA